MEEHQREILAALAAFVCHGEQGQRPERFPMPPPPLTPLTLHHPLICLAHPWLERSLGPEDFEAFLVVATAPPLP